MKIFLECKSSTNYYSNNDWPIYISLNIFGKDIFLEIPIKSERLWKLWIIAFEYHRKPSN